MFGQLSDVDLKSLRTFYTIVMCGGYTPAQVEMGVSAATISTQMSQLETRLGMRLCQRGHTGFSLTKEGEDVFSACERLFASIENFKSEVAETAEILTGEFRLGLINNTLTLSDLKVSEAIAEFSARAPQIHLVLYVGLETEVESRVMDGRLHIGVTSLHANHPRLEYHKLAEERFLVYCSDTHPLFEVPDSDLSIPDIESQSFVGGGYWEGRLDNAANLDVNVRAETPEIEGIARLILSGSFLGFLPTHYAEAWVAQGRLRPLLPEQLWNDIDVSGITVKASEKSRTLELFLQCLYGSD
jgi:DNA-binding transcriptional LysR family regulator